MACVSTVAVVVPSPASSPVLEATLLTSCAPAFLEGVFEFDLLGHAHTVLGDTGRAELFVDHHVAAFRAEGHFHGVGEGVGTLTQEFASVYVVLNIFCHLDYLLVV